MPFDGSGVFNRLYNWTDDRDSSVPILASKMDSETNGIAAAINAIINGSAPFLNPFKTVNGSAAAPAFSFAADSDTGMYRSAANELSFSTGGVLAYKIANNQVVIFENTPKVGGADVSLVGHTHDFTGDFAPITHTHDFTGDFAPITHNHDATYAPLSHSHVESDLPAYLAAAKVPDKTDFQSAGIDDNASSLRLRIGNGASLWGEGISNSKYHLGAYNPIGDGYYSVGSGDWYSNGSCWLMYTGSHSTNAYSAGFYANNSIKLLFDYSANLWDFKSTDVKTTGDMEGGEKITSKYSTALHYGFFEVKNSAGSRGGYFGYGNGTSEVALSADAATILRMDSWANVKMKKLELTSVSGASDSSTLHPLQMGLTSGANLIIDNNEILARNNGSPSELHVNGFSIHRPKSFTWAVLGANYGSTVVHNLGGNPNGWVSYFELTSAWNGWAVGAKWSIGAGANYYRGTGVAIENNDVTVACDDSSGPFFPPKGGGNPVACPWGNLKIVTKLW